MLEPTHQTANFISKLIVFCKLLLVLCQWWSSISFTINVIHIHSLHLVMVFHNCHATQIKWNSSFLHHLRLLRYCCYCDLLILCDHFSFHFQCIHIFQFVHIFALHPVRFIHEEKRKSVAIFCVLFAFSTIWNYLCDHAIEHVTRDEKKNRSKQHGSVLCFSFQRNFGISSETCFQSIFYLSFLLLTTNSN